MDDSYVRFFDDLFVYDDRFVYVGITAGAVSIALLVLPPSPVPAAVRIVTQCVVAFFRGGCEDFLSPQVGPGRMLSSYAVTVLSALALTLMLCPRAFIVSALFSTVSGTGVLSALQILVCYAERSERERERGLPRRLEAEEAVRARSAMIERAREAQAGCGRRP